MILVPGSASQELGQKIAELLKAEVVHVESKRFPDGESYIRFDGDVEDEDVAIVQTTSPPQNENLLQLFLMAGNAKDMKARTITAVVPYLAYSRQDRCFIHGEAFSMKTILTLLETCGVERIVTVDAHNPEVLKAFGIRFNNLSAFGLLAKYFKNQGFDKAFSLSLGKKGKAVAVKANNVLNGGYGCVETIRDRLTGKVNVEKKTLPVKSKDVIIFDDIISSGGTMSKAIEWIKEQGARRIYAACVHPILVGDAKDRIIRSGADGIVGTDCVSSPISLVSVAPLIAKALANEEPNSD